MAITPNLPLANAGYLYVQNLEMAFVSGTSITVAAGQARDVTNTNDIVLPALVTINAATNGLNALDTGALANNTFYAVFAVASSTSANPQTADSVRPAGALLSLSATAPTLPAGYDMFRRIGYVLTSGAAAILDFTQRANGVNRDMWYANAIATNITAGASATFAAVTASASVPVLAKEVFLEAILTADAGATRTAALRAHSSASTLGQVFMSSPASTVTTASLLCPCDASGAIDYLVSNTSAAIALNVSGYLDVL